MRCILLITFIWASLFGQDVVETMKEQAALYEGKVVPEYRRLDMKLGIVQSLKKQSVCYVIRLTHFDPNSKTHKLQISCYLYCRYELWMEGSYSDDEQNIPQFTIESVGINSVKEIKILTDGRSSVNYSLPPIDITIQQLDGFISSEFKTIGERTSGLIIDKKILGFSKTFLPASEFQQAEINLSSGEFVQFHENGKTRVKGNFDAGHTVGEWTWFDLEGNSILSEEYPRKK